MRKPNTVLVVLGVLIVPVILVLAIFLLAEDEGDAAKLIVEQKLRTPPQPEDTVLRLAATGVDSCLADDEVTDIRLDESTTEVVVEASLNIDDELFCEIRTAYEPFTVELSEPLGQRVIVDDSRGNRKVIWSPKARKDILRRQALDHADAEMHLRSKFPAAQNVDCVGGGAKYFSCGVRVPSRERPVSMYVYIRAEPKLRILAGERLPPELRTCSAEPGPPDYRFKVC